MCSSFLWVTYLVNRAQSLNSALVFSSPPTAAIFPERLDLITLVWNLILESFWFPSSYSVLFWS